MSDSVAVPAEVATFGSPRVGTKRDIQHAKVRHLRWVNNNDIVTRVPSCWLRYRHAGTRMHLDSKGEFKEYTPARGQGSLGRFLGRSCALSNGF